MEVLTMIKFAVIDLDTLIALRVRHHPNVKDWAKLINRSVSSVRRFESGKTASSYMFHIYMDFLLIERR